MGWGVRGVNEGGWSSDEGGDWGTVGGGSDLLPNAKQNGSVTKDQLVFDEILAMKLKVVSPLFKVCFVNVFPTGNCQHVRTTKYV